MRDVQHSLDLISGAPADRPFVVGQLGQSLDGRIALPSGESKYISGPAALDHLHRLRSVVDAVVVGVGTVLCDDPLLTVRRVEGRNPVRVIIDPNCRLTCSPRCLSDGAAEVIVLRREACQGEVPPGALRLTIRPAHSGCFDCGAIVEALFARGFRRILVEGGAGTISRFIDEAMLDRLHLMVSPVLLGAGKTGINLSTVDSLARALRVNAQIYRFEGGDVLFDCDMRGRA